MRIGIDVTWLKPKKSGGVEFYFKNLMDGMLAHNDNNEYVLFLAKDNEEDLKKYFNDDRISFVVCNTYAFNVKQHLIWQNLWQYKVLNKNNIDFCFFPVYEMPLYKCKKIKCVTMIHDIQAFHYPEYFSKLENIWFKMGWKKVLKNADRVVTITNYTKEDIENNFKHKNNLEAIYVPVKADENEIEDFNSIKEKYNIEENKYYYTVCSMHKHKNLITLIKVMKEIKDRNLNIPDKFVISGVGGPNKENLLKEIKELGIEDNIIITPFVSDAEKNTLMKNSNIFLFPSIFEGFGIPPVEAMEIGTRVITTKCTSLPEVTQGMCNYVDDPYKIEDWINEIIKVQGQEKKKYNFEEYDKVKIARRYLDLFYEIMK
ncbi:MAG: glycosyltransferase family 4 protein [Clostridia bacterium]|nr:glycosyltransferase family 4 protein [Clostridia bacterium]